MKRFLSGVHAAPQPKKQQQQGRGAGGQGAGGGGGGLQPAGVCRGGDGSGFVPCPVCEAMIPLATINTHLDLGCDSPAKRSSNVAACRASAAPSGGEWGGEGWGAESGGGGAGEAPGEGRGVESGNGGAGEAPGEGRGAGCGSVSSSGAAGRWWERTPGSSLFEGKWHDRPGHRDLRGEYLYPDFVTEEEEGALLRMLEDARQPPWRDSTFNGRHRGKAWGVRCDLRQRTVSEGPLPLPPLLVELAERMRMCPPMRSFYPNEANAIEYTRTKGHSLQPHIDDRQLSTEVICTLSLAGTATMTFEKRGAGRVRVALPRRALQVLTLAARYEYTHAVGGEIYAGDFKDPRRVSITFRCSPVTQGGQGGEQGGPRGGRGGQGQVRV